MASPIPDRASGASTPMSAPASGRQTPTSMRSGSTGGGSTGSSKKPNLRVAIPGIDMCPYPGSLGLPPLPDVGGHAMRPPMLPSQLSSMLQPPPAPPLMPLGATAGPTTTSGNGGGGHTHPGLDPSRWPLPMDAIRRPNNVPPAVDPSPPTDGAFAPSARSPRSAGSANESLEALSAAASHGTEKHCAPAGASKEA